MEKNLCTLKTMYFCTFLILDGLVNINAHFVWISINAFELLKIMILVCDV